MLVSGVGRAGMGHENFIQRGDTLRDDPGAEPGGEGRQFGPRPVGHDRPLFPRAGNAEGARNDGGLGLRGGKMEREPAVPGFDFIERTAERGRPAGADAGSNVPQTGDGELDRAFSP